MKNLFFASLFIILLTGCTTIQKQTLSPQAAASLKGQSVAVTAYATPDFVAMTPSKVLVPFGGLAMITEGNKIIAENKVNDPSLKIAADLAKLLEDNLGTQNIGTPIRVFDNDVNKITAATGNSVKYILDVQTFMWGLSYFPTDWTHYHIIHTARARIIDASSKAILAEGFCARPPASNAGAPTYEMMLDNNASILKRESLLASEACVKNLTMDMLALPLNNPNVSSLSSTTLATQTSEVKPTIATPEVTQVKKQKDISSQTPEAIVSQEVSKKEPAAPKVQTTSTKSAIPDYKVSEDATPTKVQTIAFQMGVSSFAVEKLANKAGCFSEQGAGLFTEKGPIEGYRVKCNNGQTFVARCELRQCKAVR
jgi:hypothetical protein